MTALGFKGLVQSGPGTVVMVTALDVMSPVGPFPILGTLTLTYDETPEPGSVAMLAGFASLIALGWRRRG